ncbi:hypothetical protein [Methanovulcanius yangii]|uniref:hypothetical protein n=1 Tax=Methanovulcanius yangii TaxID=1789227 RepID=UPI0029CA622C|nr:hypothetical protein [Methanovulcanius yangii]
MMPILVIAVSSKWISIDGEAEKSYGPSGCRIPEDGPKPGRPGREAAGMSGDMADSFRHTYMYWHAEI